MRSIFMVTLCFVYFLPSCLKENSNLRFSLELGDLCGQTFFVRPPHFIYLDSSLIKLKGWHGTDSTFSSHIFGIVNIDLDKLNVWILLG